MSTDLLLNLTAIAATVPAVLIPIAYQVLTRGAWRKTLMGRHIMCFSAMLAALLLHATVVALWSHYPGREVVRWLLYGWLVFVLWRRLYLMLRMQVAPSRHSPLFEIYRQRKEPSS